MPGRLFSQQIDADFFKMSLSFDTFLNYLVNGVGHLFTKVSKVGSIQPVGLVESILLFQDYFNFKKCIQSKLTEHIRMGPKLLL